MINKVSLEELLKEKRISQRTYDKAKIAKQIIERKYNLQDIKSAEWSYIIEKINSLDLSVEEKEKIKQEIFTLESSKYRFHREKQTIRDYESITIIGRGAFGEVHVCRHKTTGEIVAVKKIKKEVLFIKNQVIHVRNEQLFMSKVKSPWIVDLKASFQDEDYLYLVMEFLPGGDMMNLLIKKDILTEDDARFYIAELILSIESIHKLDCIHRDIKPDNILIDKNGHIKLSDFGLAKVSEKLFEQNSNKLEEFKNDNEVHRHEKNYSCVGTAYYVAPEVLIKKGYGPEIDWWSVGVIFFEMLVGYAPFCSKETSEVCHKILNWKKYLKIPAKIKISREAEDLIAKFINNPNKRLGINGTEEIKSHPFFKGLDWENILNLKAPFIPELKNEYDTHYFDNFEKKEPFYPPIKKNKKRKDVEYLGYTYRDDPKNDIDIFSEFQIAIQKLNNNKKPKNNFNMNITPNDTNISCTQCQTKTSSRLNDNKISLNKNKINNIKIQNYLEINSKTEPNNNVIIKGLETYLTKKSINKKTKNNSRDKNNSNNKEKLIILKNKKSVDEKEPKLNIIQLPTKKITKNNLKSQKMINNNNKLIAIKNAIKHNNTNNYKIITLNNIKKKIVKTSQNKVRNTSNPRPKCTKLSPSPNQKNIFLKKFLDKEKSKPKEIRDISGDNSRNITSNIKTLIKKSKSISQNRIKKIVSKNKSNSLQKRNNNLLRKNVEGKYVVYNKDKNIMRKNINVVKINNSKDIDIREKNERNISPSLKINYIYRKKE